MYSRAQIGLFVARFFRIVLRVGFGFGNRFRLSRSGSLHLRLMRQVFHALRQNLGSRHGSGRLGNRFRRPIFFHYNNSLQRHLNRLYKFFNFNDFLHLHWRNSLSRHFIMRTYARLKRKRSLLRHQFGTYGVNFGGKLAFEHIAGKLVFTIHHPYAVFFTHGQRRNPLRKLPGRQHFVKAAKAPRPKFS